MIAVLRAVLLVIAMLGLGVGVWVVAAAAKGAAGNPLGFAFALVYGSIPFAIGTIALGAVTITLSIEQAATDQIVAVNRGTEVAINEARHAAHHRAPSGGR